MNFITLQGPLPLAKRSIKFAYERSRQFEVDVGQGDPSATHRQRVGNTHLCRSALTQTWPLALPGDMGLLSRLLFRFLRHRKLHRLQFSFFRINILLLVSPQKAATQAYSPLRLSAEKSLTRFGRQPSSVHEIFLNSGFDVAFRASR